jgi:hypothetical protein
MMKLCDCAVCGEPVQRRKYQADTARVCSPPCARRLAVLEHPDIDVKGNRWRDQLPQA